MRLVWVALLCQVYEPRHETKLGSMLCHVYELRRETRLGCHAVSRVRAET